MGQLLAFAQAHQVVLGGVGAIVVSAAVRALPTPKRPDGFYRWAFDFTHLLLANWDKVGVRSV